MQQGGIVFLQSSTSMEGGGSTSRETSFVGAVDGISAAGGTLLLSTSTASAGGLPRPPSSSGQHLSVGGGGRSNNSSQILEPAPPGIHIVPAATGGVAGGGGNTSPSLGGSGASTIPQATHTVSQPHLISASTPGGGSQQMVIMMGPGGAPVAVPVVSHSPAPSFSLQNQTSSVMTSGSTTLSSTSAILNSFWQQQQQQQALGTPQGQFLSVPGGAITTGGSSSSGGGMTLGAPQTPHGMSSFVIATAGGGGPPPSSVSSQHGGPPPHPLSPSLTPHQQSGMSFHGMQSHIGLTPANTVSAVSTPQHPSHYFTFSQPALRSSGASSQAPPPGFTLVSPTGAPISVVDSFYRPSSGGPQPMQQPHAAQNSSTSFLPGSQGTSFIHGPPPPAGGTIQLVDFSSAGPSSGQVYYAQSPSGQPQVVSLATVRQHQQHHGGQAVFSSVYHTSGGAPPGSAVAMYPTGGRAPSGGGGGSSSTTPSALYPPPNTTPMLGPSQAPPTTYYTMSTQAGGQPQFLYGQTLSPGSQPLPAPHTTPSGAYSQSTPYAFQTAMMPQHQQQQQQPQYVQQTIYTTTGAAMGGHQAQQQQQSQQFYSRQPTSGPPGAVVSTTGIIGHNGQRGRGERGGPGGGSGGGFVGGHKQASAAPGARPPGHARSHSVASEGGVDDLVGGAAQASVDRATLCRHYMQGTCNRRKCRFLHAMGPLEGEPGEGPVPQLGGVGGSGGGLTLPGVASVTAAGGFGGRGGRSNDVPRAVGNPLSFNGDDDDDILNSSGVSGPGGTSGQLALAYSVDSAAGGGGVSSGSGGGLAHNTGMVPTSSLSAGGPSAAQQQYHPQHHRLDTLLSSIGALPSGGHHPLPRSDLVGSTTTITHLGGGGLHQPQHYLPHNDNSLASAGSLMSSQYSVHGVGDGDAPGGATLTLSSVVRGPDTSYGE